MITEALSSLKEEAIKTATKELLLNKKTVAEIANTPGFLFL